MTKPQLHGTLPSDDVANDRSMAAFVKVGQDGKPRLEGVKCRACGEVMVGEFRCCPKCATVGSLEPSSLAGTGKLYSYTIVYRSFPGVPTPIISSIVRLDDGAFVRGNLEGIAADPAVIPFDLPVRVQFDYSTSTSGERLVRPVFVPADRQDSGHE